MLQNSIVVVYGKKGKGKTTLLERLTAPVRDVVIFDAFGEYSPARMAKRVFDDRLYGFERLATGDKLLRAAAGWIGRKDPLRVAFSPVGGDQEDHLLDVFRAAVQRYRKTKQHLTVVIDEADMFNTGHQTSPIIDEMVKRGRHIALNQIYATRRPYELSRMVSSQADHFYVFQTTEPRDLDFLKRILPAAAVAHVPTLGIGEYVHFDVLKDKSGIYRRA